MKRVMIALVLAGLVGVAALSLRAENRPPGDGGGDGGGPGQNDMGPGGPPPGGPGMGGSHEPGMGGPGGPGGPGHRVGASSFDQLRGYIEVVDRFSSMSQDPTRSGVAAVISAQDLLRSRGPEAAIEYFTKTLPDVKNLAVQRAIRLQLIDLYKTAGQSDKALEQLDILMKSAPAESSSPAPAAK